MKVAFATQELARIDAHLGWARHLMIYEVSAEGARHLRTATFRQGLLQDGDHGKLIPRLRTLKGCTLVFAAAIGPDGERELARARIAPMRGFAGQPIAAALDALQDGLRTNPAGWLRREQQRERLGDRSLPR